MQARLESFVKCDEQPWPDCGGPCLGLRASRKVLGREDFGRAGISAP